MECLSDELLLLLFSYIAVNSARDLLSICCTCRGFNRVGMDQSLWKLAASKHLEVEIFSFKPRLVAQQDIDWRRFLFVC